MYIYLSASVHKFIKKVRKRRLVSNIGINFKGIKINSNKLITNGHTSVGGFPHISPETSNQDAMYPTDIYKYNIMAHYTSTDCDSPCWTQDHCLENKYT